MISALYLCVGEILINGVRLHAGSLKLAMVGVLISWKLADALIRTPFVVFLTLDLRSAGEDHLIMQIKLKRVPCL